MVAAALIRRRRGGAAAAALAFALAAPPLAAQAKTLGIINPEACSVYLLAWRPRAEKFMESPALEAAEGTLAGNRHVESVAGAAQRIQVVRGEAGPRAGKRRMLPPWWILLLSVPFAACAGFLYFWLFFGPEPVGWMVQVDDRVGSEGWNRIATVLPDSPAASAGIQSGDLISSKIWISSVPNRTLTNFNSRSSALEKARN